GGAYPYPARHGSLHARSCRQLAPGEPQQVMGGLDTGQISQGVAGGRAQLERGDVQQGVTRLVIGADRIGLGLSALQHCAELARAIRGHADASEGEGQP
ncbi:hypothetical protein, partial [Pseudomonas syringae group genomosp. 3]|uniref:hypothetical protein n=1 Tax=Pseudomonas syringae group genomosp. 3 TaxID=251701 RepID=UPI0018E088E1